MKEKAAKRSAPGGEVMAEVEEEEDRRCAVVGVRCRLEAEGVNNDDAMPAVNERLRRDGPDEEEADEERASSAASDMESEAEAEEEEVSEGGAEDGVRGTVARAAAAAARSWEVEADRR